MASAMWMRCVMVPMMGLRMVRVSVRVFVTAFVMLLVMALMQVSRAVFVMVLGIVLATESMCRPASLCLSELEAWLNMGTAFWMM